MLGLRCHMMQTVGDNSGNFLAYAIRSISVCEVQWLIDLSTTRLLTEWVEICNGTFKNGGIYTKPATTKPVAWFYSFNYVN